MKIKFKELAILNIKIGSLKNTKGFSASKTIKLLHLKINLNLEAEKYQSLLENIMNGYSIKAQNGMYVWAEHEKAEEINKEVDDLREQSVDIDVDLNFLSEEEFVQVTEGQSMEDLANLSKYLLSQPAA